MLGKLRNIWQSSDFARENLSFLETVGLLLEKHGYPRDTLVLGKTVEDGVQKEIFSEFSRAVNGEPLGYVLGKVSFFNEEYFVESGVLIPRRDSEVLVETAVSLIPQGTHFIDVCTGSGCLGISTLVSRPDLKATLLDVSLDSQRVAQKNIVNMKIEDRCEFRLFDFFSDSFSEIPDFSAVIMNPPYITKSEMKTLPINVKQEPSLALDGGEDGLDFYRFASRQKAFDGKLLIFEIGYKQADALLALFGGGSIIKDYCGNDRVFVIDKTRK